MGTSQSRTPKGVPTGGQFGASTHPEADGLLDASEADLSPAAVLVAVRAEVSQWAADRTILEEELATHIERGKELRRRLGDAEWAVATQSDGGSSDLADSGTSDFNTPDAEGVWDSRSEFVQGGGVADKVLVPWQGSAENGTVFHRRQPGVHPGWPYALRLQFAYPINDAEMRHAAQLIGYAYRSTVAGEAIGDPVRDSPYSFVVSADTTKTQRDDVGMALEEFEGLLPHMLQNGSPVRKTNRAGPGTEGTRLIEGLGRASDHELYYDDISG